MPIGDVLELGEQGFYGLGRDGEELAVLAANVDVRESDLAAVDAEELGAALAPTGSAAGATPGCSGGADAGRARVGPGAVALPRARRAVAAGGRGVRGEPTVGGGDSGVRPRRDEMVSDVGHTYDELLRAIHTTRRRWRLKILLRGLAVFLLAGFATVGVSVWALDRFHYGDVPVAVIRALVWIALAALAVRFLVLPFLRRVSDRQVALYIEEHEPKLEAELLSAVELGAAADGVARRRSPARLPPTGWSPR